VGKTWCVLMMVALPVPSSMTVAAGTTSKTFTVSTVKPGSDTTVTISATYAGATKTANLTVKRH
jgi:hypothetical protein